MVDRLERPGLPPLAYARRAGAAPTFVFLPGYGSDMDGTKAKTLDAWAEARGQGLLRFDYRGCGASGGVFGEASLDDWRDDALDAIDALTDGPLVLVGSSMGGWLMLLVALERSERVKALIGIAAAPDFTDWSYDDDSRSAIAEDGLLARHTPYSDEPEITTAVFWRSGQANLLLGGGIPITCPVRLLHGLDDAEVPPSIAFRLGRALRSADVQTVFVKGGDHRLSRPADLALLCATAGALIETL